MQELALVIPGQLLAQSAAGGFGRAVPRWRFSGASRLGLGWRGQLCDWLGDPQLAAWPAAGAVAAASAVVVGASGNVTADSDHSGCAAGAWLASPLHWVAGMDRVHLPIGGLLRLTDAEQAELAAGFNRDLGNASGVVLRCVAADAFLLTGLEATDVRTTEPLAMLGREVGEFLPSGGNARVLRAMMSEVEMWLHQHPVNAARERLGLPAISALWCWGGGVGDGGGARSAAESAHRRRSAALASVSARASGAVTLSANDAWTRALGTLAGVVVRPVSAAGLQFESARSPETPLVVVVLDAPLLVESGAFEALWLQPAVGALRDGGFTRLTLLCQDREISLAATDEWRLWRPRRDWRTALHS